MTAKEIKKEIDLHISEMIEESHKHLINPKSIRLDFMEGLERLLKNIEDKETNAL